MKKIYLLLLLAAIYNATGCTKQVLPCCIQQQIDQCKHDPNSIKSQVDEYIFQGRKVYVFIDDNRIADGGVNVIDENCNQLCFLGGIAGFTMCNGDNFYAKAVFKRTVWKR